MWFTALISALISLISALKSTLKSLMRLFSLASLARMFHGSVNPSGKSTSHVSHGSGGVPRTCLLRQASWPDTQSRQNISRALITCCWNFSTASPFRQIHPFPCCSLGKVKGPLAIGQELQGYKPFIRSSQSVARGLDASTNCTTVLCNSPLCQRLNPLASV